MFKKIQFNIFFCTFIVAGFLLCTLPETKAVGSPDYLPDGPHPRIWLTPEKMTMLQAKVNANDHDWLSVKAIADQYLTYAVPAYNATARTDGTIYYNYEGAGWYNAIIYLGLAYKFTGNTTYADKMKELIDVIDAAGNAPVQVDSGYPTRYLPSGMALAYDWLYDYLDTNTKTAMINTVNNWYDWYKMSAYNSNDATGTGNYYGGHIYGFGLAGLATYGENSRANEINQYISSKWNTDVVPAFANGAFAGGYAVESYCSYGVDNFQRLLGYAKAVKDSTGRDIANGFGNKIATALIYNLKPNRWQATDEGTQSGNTGWVMDGGLALKLTDLLSDSDANQMAYYYQNLAPTPIESATTSLQQPTDYDKFLYDFSQSQENYTLTRPLFYRSLGDEHLISRSDWEDSSTWSSFNGGVAHFTSHQQQIAGHISLQRGNDYLLVNAGEWRGANGYSGSPAVDKLTSVTGNTLYFDDGGVYNRHDSSSFEGGQEWSGINNILNFEGNSNYVYEKADLTSAYYTARYGFPISARTLTYFYRNYVSFDGGATIFVYDRIKVTDASYVKRLQWYLNPQNAPIINGSLVTSDVGSSRLHLKTVYPVDAVVNLSVNPVTERCGTLYGNRLEVSAPTLTDFNPLTIILSTDISTVTMPITGINTVNMQGAVVDGTAPKISLFSKNGTAQNVVTYNAEYSEGVNGDHILLDMQPGDYDIYQNGSKILTEVIASSQGVLNFSAEGGGSFQVVVAGQQSESDTSPPYAPSGLLIQ